MTFRFFALFIMTSFIQICTYATNTERIMPDLKIDDISYNGKEVIVSFQNYGLVEIEKLYRIQVQIGQYLFKSKPLKMLAATGQQEYAFDLKKNQPTGSKYVLATIDIEKTIQESDEDNFFIKRVNFLPHREVLFRPSL